MKQDHTSGGVCPSALSDIGLFDVIGREIETCFTVNWRGDGISKPYYLHDKFLTSKKSVLVVGSPAYGTTSPPGYPAGNNLPTV
jgi:hypothetical protein